MQPNTANAGSCRLSNHAKSSAPTSIAKTHLWSRRNQRADGGVLEISALKTNHPGKTGCSTCRESAVGLTEQSPVTTGTWLLLGNNTCPMWGSTSSWHLPAPWESASPIPAPRDAQWGEGEQHRGQAEDRGVMQCAQPQGLAGYRRVDGRTGRKLQGMEERWTDRRTDSRWFSDVSPPLAEPCGPAAGCRMDKLPEDFGPLQGCSTSPRLVLEGWQQEVGAQTVPLFPNGNTAASSSLLLPALRGQYWSWESQSTRRVMLGPQHHCQEQPWACALPQGLQ